MVGDEYEFTETPLRAVPGLASFALFYPALKCRLMNVVASRLGFVSYRAGGAPKSPSTISLNKSERSRDCMLEP